MKSEIVKAEYQAFEVLFTEEGWINATEIAEKFGKRLDHWMENQETRVYITALDKHLNTPNSGDLARTKRGRNGGTWLHPKLAVAFGRWLSPDFAIWCDVQIDSLLNHKHPHHDWKRQRHIAASSYKVVGQILKLTRERLGKPTEPHHYSNEARLINWALTGKFCSVDREGLGIGDLDLLAKLENMDTVLIGCGMPYEERKAEMARYAAECRVATPMLAAA